MPRKFKEKKAEKFTYMKGKKVKVEAEEKKSDNKVKPDNKKPSNNEFKKKDQ